VLKIFGSFGTFGTFLSFAFSKDVDLMVFTI